MTKYDHMPDQPFKYGAIVELDDRIRALEGTTGAARRIDTVPPLAGGGDLSADRLLSIDPASHADPGSMSNTDKEKLDSLADATLASGGDQLIANGGGSLWLPPVISMREMFTVSGTDPKAEYATIHAAVDAAVAAGAAKTFNLQFYSVDGGVVGIQDARIEIWRVA
jgi:hypothetical protein